MTYHVLNVSYADWQHRVPSMIDTYACDLILLCTAGRKLLGTVVMCENQKHADITWFVWPKNNLNFIADIDNSGGFV